MKFRVPSKSFLLGEYVALSGGPALLLSHEPCFEIEFLENSQAEMPFHPESPAALWADLHEELFENVEIQFKDPYEEAGGFGASTAQFLAVYLYVLQKNNMLKQGAQFTELQKWAIREDYINLYEGQKNPPSGYDLLAQLSGGLQGFQTQKQQIMSFSWPFKDIEIVVYKTKHKVATHTHLKNLDISPNTYQALQAATEEAIQSLKDQKQNEFFKVVKSFSQEQNQLGLLKKHSFDLINEWQDQNGVFAARGCGALGADVFMVFKDKNITLSSDLEQDLQKISVFPSSTSLGVELSQIQKREI